MFGLTLSRIESHRSGLSGLDLDLATVSSVAIVEWVRGRVQLKAVPVPSDGLTKAADEVAIGRELAARVRSLQSVHDLIGSSNVPTDVGQARLPPKAKP